MGVPVHRKVGLDLVDHLTQEVVSQEWPDLGRFTAERRGRGSEMG